MDFKNPLKDLTDPEEIYRRLIKEAPKIRGDTGEKIDSENIPWANQKLIQEGQEFVKRNSMAIMLSHIGTLMVGLSIKSVSTILFRNGNFTDTFAASKRYVETGEHMMTWYNSDILGQTSVGNKDIQIVKEMHNLALKKCARNEEPFVPDESIIPEGRRKILEEYLSALRADLKCVDTSGAPVEIFDYNPKPLMSQYDLAITQFGFFGFIIMCPNNLGIKDKSGIDGFIHLWAILGKLLGIQDRYNLALYPDKTLYQKIFDKIIVSCIQTSDIFAANAQFDYGNAVGDLLLVASPLSLMYFGLSGAEAIPQFEGKELRRIMSWSDLFKLKCMQFILFLMYHFDWVRNGANKLFLIQSERNRNKILSMKRNRNSWKK